MEKTMKAAAVLEPGRVEIVELPLPAFGPYECLVRTWACGFCSSTDMKIIHNAIADLPVQYPTILGHEGAGEIVAAGERVKNYRVGDRVTCARGVCVQGTPYTFTWGEMAQYAIVHDVQAMAEAGIDIEKAVPGKTLRTYPVRKIPEGMSYADAVMLLTFEENYSALLNFGVSEGQDVLLIGDGIVAQGLCFFAGVQKVRSICCIGHHDSKLARFRQLPKVDCTVNSRTESVEEALGERRFDIVIDAAGSMAAIRQGFRYVKDGGKVCVYGVLKREDAEFNLFDMRNHSSLHLLTWPYEEHRTHEAVVRLIEESRLVPSAFYSHVLPLEQIHQAIDLIRSRTASKVILDMR